jgi:hypothetical protein
MRNKKSPRPTAGRPAGSQDRVVEAMRDIPRMRAVEELEKQQRVYEPPPPFASRLGGMAQGCGGVLLILMAIVMFLAALWFGYYLWGPGLLLAGGLLLVGGAVGVWRGRQAPLLMSIAVIAMLTVVGFLWYSFVPAAGALAPLGGLGMMLSMVVLLVILTLIGALVSHVIALLYWRRLGPATQRSLIAWAGVSGVLVMAALAFHSAQQTQRMAWLDERLADWSAQATADSLHLGSTANVTLGYSFVTVEAADDDRLDVRLAELRAAVEAGAQVLRVTASGDMLWEAQLPRLFKPDENQDPAQEEAEIAARITRQRDDEATYLGAVAELGVDLIVSDAQYTPYLLVKAGDEQESTWEEFAQLQEERVRHYARALQPLAYEVVSEPGQYAHFSGIARQENVDEIGLWVAQTERLATAVREESPETLVGVTVSISDDYDLDFYEQVLALEAVDFIGVRIFQPAALDLLEDIFAERGHPADHGKEVWVLETWYGYCLAPQRSMKLDARWLEAVAAFAAKERITTVLVNDYGCFLQEGGTLFQAEVDLQGRTEVWQRWQELIRTWRPA